MAFSDSIGLLFRVDGDPSGAVAAFKKVESEGKSSLSALSKGGSDELDKLTGSSSKLGSAFSALGNPLALAATGVAAVGTAAITAGVALFNIAKNASDFGSQIKDVSQKTGYGAESVSTLKLAADQGGSSLEQISGSLVKFSKLIGDSATGSDKATTSLVRLGLDPKEAINDLEGSLAKVFKAINDAKNPIVATKLATDAFGKSGADLIPVIKQMNGDFAGFKEEAKKLGVVLSDDDASAADDFGDALTALEKQASGVAFQFAKEFLPTLTRVFNSLSATISDNASTFKRWGKEVDSVLSKLSSLQAFLQSGGGDLVLQAIQYAANSASGGVLLPSVDTRSPLRAEANVDTSNIDKRNEEQTLANNNAAEEAKQAAEKRQKEREAAYKKEIAAQSEQNKLLLDANREGFEANQKAWEDAFLARTETQENFSKNSLANLQTYADSTRKQLEEAFKLDSAGKTGTELENAQLEFQKAITALDKRVAAERIGIEKTITDANKKEGEARLKQTQEQSARRLEIEKSSSATRIAEIERDTKLGLLKESEAADAIGKIKTRNLEDEKKELEALDQNEETKQRIKILDEEIAQARIAHSQSVVEAINNETAAEKAKTQAILDGATASDPAGNKAAGLQATPDSGVFQAIDDIFGLSDTAIDKVTGKTNVLKGVFGDLSTSVKGAAQGMTDALGSAIEGYLLYGDSIGKALKQAAAAELAHIASVSAIKAIYQLAEGFASLFFNPAAAAAHFQAAALYGLVSIGAGIGAKALAGNKTSASSSFASQTSTGTGGGSSSNSSNGGQAYSGRQPASVREEDRIRTGSQRPREIIELRLPSGMIDRGILDALNNRTDAGNALIRLAEG